MRAVTATEMMGTIHDAMANRDARGPMPGMTTIIMACMMKAIEVVMTAIVLVVVVATRKPCRSTMIMSNIMMEEEMLGHMVIILGADPAAELVMLESPPILWCWKGCHLASRLFW